MAAFTPDSASDLVRRVMCLVHSSDPQIEFAPVGAMPLLWNDAEQSNASRRVG
ncbi:hypothetical protein ACH4ZU_08185 [Streptomyces sp. NPDC020472]|uniref:hypothetical protein n=1 Tax=Streptomyces sp. NPDC020472 TaxID=3365075 RepID=UPI0037BA50F2